MDESHCIKNDKSVRLDVQLRSVMLDVQLTAFDMSTIVKSAITDQIGQIFRNILPSKCLFSSAMSKSAKNFNQTQSTWMNKFWAEILHVTWRKRLGGVGGHVLSALHFAHIRILLSIYFLRRPLSHFFEIAVNSRWPILYLSFYHSIFVADNLSINRIIYLSSWSKTKAAERLMRIAATPSFWVLSWSILMYLSNYQFKSYICSRTKAAEPLMRDSRYLILLTGTPALSRPMELFSQVIFL